MSDVTDRSAYDPFAPVSEPDAPELTEEAAAAYTSDDGQAATTGAATELTDVTIGTPEKPILAEEIHPNETIETNMPSTTEVEVEDSNG